MHTYARDVSIARGCGVRGTSSTRSLAVKHNCSHALAFSHACTHTHTPHTHTTHTPHTHTLIANNIPMGWYLCCAIAAFPIYVVIYKYLLHSLYIYIYTVYQD